jgi:hypothetical protein
MLTTATPAGARAWNRLPGSMTALALASTAAPASSSLAIASSAWPTARARPRNHRAASPPDGGLSPLHFSEDSPERDFAAIEFLGRKVWMKIDYYDAAMEFGSEDPADASITTRVMTILLPEDY